MTTAISEEKKDMFEYPTPGKEYLPPRKTYSPLRKDYPPGSDFTHPEDRKDMFDYPTPAKEYSPPGKKYPPPRKDYPPPPPSGKAGPPDVPEEHQKAHEKNKIIKRPLNAFMIWSQKRRREILENNPSLHNSEVSKMLGAEWREMSDEQKSPFWDEAHALMKQHKLDHPHYLYRPRRRQNKRGGGGGKRGRYVNALTAAASEKVRTPPIEYRSPMQRNDHKRHENLLDEIMREYQPSSAVLNYPSPSGAVYTSPKNAYPQQKYRETSPKESFPQQQQYRASRSSPQPAFDLNPPATTYIQRTYRNVPYLIESKRTVKNAMRSYVHQPAFPKWEQVQKTNEMEHVHLTKQRRAVTPQELPHKPVVVPTAVKAEPRTTEDVINERKRKLDFFLQASSDEEPETKPQESYHQQPPSRVVYQRPKEEMHGAFRKVVSSKPQSVVEEYPVYTMNDENNISDYGSSFFENVK